MFFISLVAIYNNILSIILSQMNDYKKNATKYVGKYKHNFSVDIHGHKMANNETESCLTFTFFSVLTLICYSKPNAQRWQ